MTKFCRIVTTIWCILFIIALVLSAFLYWYYSYDVTGLVLYKDELIQDLIPYYSQIYIVTEEGDVYITVDHTVTNDRKLINSQSYPNDILNTGSPVKIYDGKIAKIIPYGSVKTLLINENGELFDFDDFETTKLADGVFYAIRVHYSHGEMIFGEGNEKIYYVIDTNNVLYAMNGEGEKKELFSDVVSVDYYLDTLLVLFKNGDLNQYSISDGSTIVLKEKIFENVGSFDIRDTSLRLDGERLVFDDEEAKKKPLINVLTFDGSLYVKGAYNLLCCTISIAATPTPKIIDEWTLIAENVESFSMAPMGTAFKYKDNTAAYYGFDTDNSSDSENKFGYLDLGLTNVTTVYADDVEVTVQTNKTFYTWGFALDRTFDVSSSKNYNLFDGEPHIITVP